MALTNSATDVWEEFDIDKTIVINDFETNVFGTYDLVDDVDYSVNLLLDLFKLDSFTMQEVNEQLEINKTYLMDVQN